MRFIRKNGRIIPIRDPGDRQERDPKGSNVKAAGVAGTAVGAGYHLHQEHQAELKEASIKNSRNLKSFSKKLKPGDILVAGSSAKHASGISVEDAVSALPNKLQKPALKTAKFFGLKKTTLLTNNATILPLAGAGKKYHAAVYLGKGKVAHMTTDAGAWKESLGEAIDKQNVTAYRFKDASRKEVNKAIHFASTAAKRHTPYQSFKEYSKNALSNYGVPFGKKATRSYSPMVCHTLALRAYSDRQFSKRGELTFAGDFKKAPGISPVAKRNVVKTAGTSLKAYAGIAGRGLKWGAAAAGATYVASHIFSGKKEKK